MRSASSDMRWQEFISNIWDRDNKEGIDHSRWGSFRVWSSLSSYSSFWNENKCKTPKTVSHVVPVNRQLWRSCSLNSVLVKRKYVYLKCLCAPCCRAQRLLIQEIEDMSFQTKKSQKVIIIFHDIHQQFPSVYSILGAFPFLARFFARLARIRRRQWGLSALGVRAGTHCGSAWRMIRPRAQSQVVWPAAALLPLGSSVC